MAKLDVKKIIETNRNVRRKDFAAADRLSREMLSEGARRNAYRIDAPGAGRRITIGDNDTNDSRTLKLTHGRLG